MNMSLRVEIAAPLIGIVLMAAVTDARRGEIPNWLTLPIIGLSPFLLLIIEGWRGALAALLGIVGCGLIPYLQFRRGGMGGGDVKLLAAIGGLTGLAQGVEIQVLGFLLAAVYSALAAAFKGRLPLFAARQSAAEIDPASAKPRRLRLGPFFCAGTLVSLCGFIRL